MKNIEVELKFPLPSDSNLLSFLQENATFLEETYQKDEYFSPSYKDFFAINPVVESLRIRESAQGTNVNYKKRAVTHCDEYETSLQDPEQIALIFQALDIRPVMYIHKKRISFLYQETEISLDQVEGLGMFVELEMKGDFETPKEAEKYLHKVALQLGLSPSTVEKRGYANFIMEKKALL